MLAALAGTLITPGAAGARTVWLCRPGRADDPCEPSLKTTVFSPSGQKLSVQKVKRVKNRRFDCFYVYPTTSDQPTPLATLDVDPELKSIALSQAARYSRDCRVFAPVYRQITLTGEFGGGLTKANAHTAYASVAAAWRDYLERYNRGRGVVFIGHSQGSYLLRRLLASKVDRKRSARRRLISAILLGGNVEVAKGRDSGGDFQHIPACRSKRQIRCVIAFSAFDATPPAGAEFGRPGAGGPFWTSKPGTEVLCTNPADLAGRSGHVTPVFPTVPFAPGATLGAVTKGVGFAVPQVATEWAAYPNAYKASCASATGANVLRIVPLAGAPALRAVPSAGFGLHLVDANIALGNLADIVRRQGEVYSRTVASAHVNGATG